MVIVGDHPVEIERILDAVDVPMLGYVAPPHRYSVGEDERAVAVAVVAVALLFGALIELCQGLLSYRSFDWGDLLANALGAGLGALWLLVERRVRYVAVDRHSGDA